MILRKIKELGVNTLGRKLSEIEVEIILAEIFGWVGFALIVLAYIILTLSDNLTLFYFTNIVGTSFVIVNLYILRNTPILLINVFILIMLIMGIIRHL